MALALTSIGVFVLDGGTTLFEDRAGAQIPQPNSTTVSVRKVVVGEATTEFTVEMVCDSSLPIPNTHVLLHFDRSGVPTTTENTLAFHVVDGAWQVSSNTAERMPCTFIELDAGGALSTHWSCGFSPEPPAPPPTDRRLGCWTGSFNGGNAAPATFGEGPGPFTVYFGGTTGAQNATVVFTNQFPAPVTQPAVTTPAFTGCHEMPNTVGAQWAGTGWCARSSMSTSCSSSVR